MTTRKKLVSSAAVWSLVIAILVLGAYLWPAYLRSTGQFETSAVLSSLAASLLTPTLFWWQLCRYFLTLLLVQFLFFYLLAEVVRWRYVGWARAGMTLVIWGVGLICLQTVNSGFFPHSALAFPLAFGMIMPFVAAALLAALLVAGAVLAWWRGVRRWRWGVLAPSIALLAFWAGLVGYRWVTTGPQVTLPTDKPNIIMIGIDGLRPDQLAYMHTFNPTYKSPMPFLDKQLAQSVVFTQAFTTVARTYPSWMAMLTGQGPLHSGVRFNYQDDYGWWKGKVLALPQYLAEKGYRSLWAIDDPDFANIGKRQGFDTTVEAEAGAAYFLIRAFMVDIPLVSMLSNTRIGGDLFPVVSMRRGIGFAYYPSTFSTRLARAVAHSDRQHPLFLAVHYQLAHYPSIWADDGLDMEPGMVTSNLDALYYYRYELARIDLQIANLMNALRQDGRLDNALVVFLSDHGNGFALGKFLYNRFGEKVWVGDGRHGVGHGSAVTNLSQNHSLLAVRGFGQQALPPGYRDNIVNLMDIAPTILERQGITHTVPMQGVPLNLDDKREGRRTVYFETGIFFPGLASGKLNLAHNLAVKAKTFRIRSNGRLVLRDKDLPRKYAMQSLAAYDGKYLIAQKWNHETGQHKTVVINRADGVSRPADAGSLSAPGARQLASDFCRHYGENNAYFTKPDFCQENVPDK